MQKSVTTSAYCTDTVQVSRISPALCLHSMLFTAEISWEMMLPCWTISFSNAGAAPCLRWMRFPKCFCGDIESTCGVVMRITHVDAQNGEEYDAKDTEDPTRMRTSIDNNNSDVDGHQVSQCELGPESNKIGVYSKSHRLKDDRMCLCMSGHGHADCIFCCAAYTTLKRSQCKKLGCDQHKDNRCMRWLYI